MIVYPDVSPVAEVVQSGVDAVGVVGMQELGGFGLAVDAGVVDGEDGQAVEVADEDDEGRPVAVAVAGTSMRPWRLASWTLQSTWHWPSRSVLSRCASCSNRSQVRRWL